MTVQQLIDLLKEANPGDLVVIETPAGTMFNLDHTDLDRRSIDTGIVGGPTHAVFLRTEDNGEEEEATED